MSLSFLPAAQAMWVIAVQVAFPVNSTRETPKINSMVAALKVTVAALAPKINAAPTACKTKGAGYHHYLLSGAVRRSLHHLEEKRR